MDFYQGNVLRIDLSTGTSAVEPLNMEWAEKYVGGKGLLLRYMWDEVPAKVDPWAPENPVILMTGPFAGTNVSTASRLVVTIGGTGRVPRAVPRFRARGAMSLTSGVEHIAHVFLSEDGGFSWRPIDAPGMPDLAYHAAVFETHEPYRLFVANDCGVWMSQDFAAWTDISTTLPNALISDLVYHHRDLSLTAATYGRGIWRVIL